MQKVFRVDPTPGNTLPMPDDKRIESTVELGNALEAMVNTLYLLRVDCGDPARVLQWVEMADRQLQRMDSILQLDLRRAPNSGALGTDETARSSP
jgi:hypothetical protein